MFWKHVMEAVEADGRAFLALVADHTRHSPGTRGARMLVRRDGTIEGTIGGGVMEADILSQGIAALHAGRLADDTMGRVEPLYHRKEAEGATSGLICAGVQTNVYYLCGPDDLDVLREAARRVEDDATGVLRLSPEGMILGEGGASRDALPVRVQAQGGRWCYEEQLLELRRAAIFGGGHCGLALSRTLAQLGYVVTLFETRPDVFTFRQNDFARHRMVVDDYAEGAARISHPEVTHVIVMTSDLPSDVRALLGALRLDVDWPYVGVMGAHAKLRRILRKLLELGISQERVDAVRAPIGLPMTSNTPEEIAISVAAELLGERENLFPGLRPSAG